ncbi:structural maintenance of chromosome protein 3 [Crepidotus variabilis]|uniref:Structural maintenance of chromosomes protein n=1 Tax=Crepidotus variabilis TaxID=179855 RepID=A0A9P6JKD5_9AGAR|nr:structural maintenance of chromosome protein 3 [Crepidotus variabilis]
MYIKTLTIQGFKSYRDQTQIEPFSPKHNVVVGRNGSGKSNFFAAIRFVLSDAYTSMSREERQALLHEGVSSNTFSAFVEIIFDNSDNRFPTGHEEVILRRTIGQKKDEYSLDKKSSSKGDVMNLLESAGFSKSNPYYIVPQGRITALTNAKDHERLALLKEVAGTKVYEQRRTESLKIMADTDAKRGKINELLEYIESRLQELEEEKEELKEFQEKDKERRCLEYALYQRELEDVGETLDQLEEDRRSDIHGSNVRREKYTEREKQIQILEKDIAESRHALETVAQTRRDTQAELTDFVRSRTELECIVEDLQVANQNSGGRREDMETELEEVEAKIAEKEALLEELIPEWEEQRAQEISEKRRLDEANAKLNALFAKQGRASKFRTRADRDQFLRQETASVNSFKKSQEAVLQSTEEDLENARRSQAEIDGLLENVHGKIDDGKKRMKEIQENVTSFKEQQADMMEKRKDLWREDTKLDSLVSHAADELRTAERLLAGMMDKDTNQGLKAVDSIAERYNLRGVYGPLYRLFDVPDPKYNIAIELTAGNSLFHVVVDTDETASKVLDVMLKEKTGRVTFMPLNRLKPKNTPTPNTHEVEPLIEKINFDPKYEKAFQQVFGKTCVCKELTMAAAYVKSHGINTITLDGDKVDRKGALTGGYHDVRRSRIEAIKSVASCRTKYDSGKAKSVEVKASIATLEHEITQVGGKVTVALGQLNQIRDSRDRLLDENQVLLQRQERLKERVEKLDLEAQELGTELTGLQAKIEAYTAEMKTPLANGITAEEEKLLEDLGREVEKRKKEMLELGKRKNELEGKKNTLEIELKERLKRRREELSIKLDALEEPAADEGSSIHDLESRTRELKTLNTSIDNLKKRIQGIEREGEELTTQVQHLRSNLENVQGQQTEDSRSIFKQQKTTERYLAKRQMLMTRKDECNRNIRDLGVLPEEAFEKYVNDKLEKLVKKLHVVNEGLKKFAHVNKKAFEQYTNFTKQRDQLLERREELDKSAESIEELVQVLDQRKDEAIERTFKQVASNFEEVFEKLVPAGRGRLIIQRRIDQEEEPDDEAEETQQSSVDNYTGVSIKVSFNSKVDEGLRIQQLSGGQKSLVALATVFAIQKCDPAPFYLFDEIDANLDAQYRTAVAAMIQSLSSTAQFVTTTFRPEMLVTADKFYGVLFNNQKVSSIRSIKREEAMEFVDQVRVIHVKSSPELTRVCRRPRLNDLKDLLQQFLS